MNIMTRMGLKSTILKAHAASLIITALSIAVASQPVCAQKANLGSSSEKTAIVAKKTKSVPERVSPVSPPEAGVQLLMGILQRIGNEPQVAMQQNAVRQEEFQAPSFLASQNAVDPAFVIRPQAKKAKEIASKPIAKPSSSEQLLASLPKRRQLQIVAADADAGLSQTNAGKIVQGTFDNQYRAKEEGSQAAASASSWNRLAGNINKMYTATKFVEEITARKPDNNPAAGAPLDEIANNLADSESRVIKSGYYNRGVTTSAYPKVTEYGKDSQQVAAAPSQSSLGMGRKLNPSGGMYGAEMNEAKREAESDKNQTMAKLDQPGLYKYTREYAAAPPAESAEIGVHSNSKASKSLRSGFTNGTQIAYMPPQLVSGIPGLRLGVDESQVDAYLKIKSKSNGKVTRQKFNGWKVWSLNSERTNKTLLQVFLRNGVVEAFRVFDPAFVPEGLGVALADKLPNMKKKFGEQQFILNEPSSQGNAVARNYVYPVNQVSFQLARSSPKEPPTVQSLLLFQFL